MDLSACRDSCIKVHVACLHAATHVLTKGEAHPRDLVRVLWDCADQAVVEANLMSRGSPLHTVTCGACAELCDACAARCVAQEGGSDPILRQCADDCRDCARRCRDMARHAHDGRAAAQ
jgi:hypothetical protein